MIEQLKIQKFTAFSDITLDFCPGINVFVGDNGTGKTHIIKLLYSILSALRGGVRISDKIAKVFLPKEMRIGRLVKRKNKSTSAAINLLYNGKNLALSFSNHTKDNLEITNNINPSEIGESVYIPVKEMLSNAPGFRSLYNAREIHFEEVYADIVDKAFLPILKGPASEQRKKLLMMIQKIMAGKIVLKDENFYLRNSDGELEFTLLAEGFRKFGLLWLLIQNGTLLSGSSLFWDEPEANINPIMMRPLIEILIHLQREGVQIFLATHSYVILREIDLQKTKGDKIKFIQLSKKDENIVPLSGKNYSEISENKIASAYEQILEQELAKGLSGQQE